VRALLDQQPDRGHAILKRLQPSADPIELRAAIDATSSGEHTRALWPLTGLFPAKVDEHALADFVAAYHLAPIAAESAASQKFQTKEDWQAYLTAPGAIALHGRTRRAPAGLDRARRSGQANDTRPARRRVG